MRDLQIKPPRYNIETKMWHISATWTEEGELHTMGGMLLGNGDEPLSEKMEREIYKSLMESVFRND